MELYYLTYFILVHLQFFLLMLHSRHFWVLTEVMSNGLCFSGERHLWRKRSERKSRNFRNATVNKNDCQNIDTLFILNVVRKLGIFSHLFDSSWGWDVQLLWILFNKKNFCKANEETLIILHIFLLYWLESKQNILVVFFVIWG